MVGWQLLGSSLIARLLPIIWEGKEKKWVKGLILCEKYVKIYSVVCF